VPVTLVSLASIVALVPIAARTAHAQSAADPTVQAWQAQYANPSQTTTFRIPTDMPVASPLVPGEQVTAAYTPFTSPMPVTKNNAAGLFGSILTNAALNQTQGFAFIPTANTAPLYPQYESDGDAVSSCDEWVYKKYYGYRRFQDAAATCGGNPDCIYNLWASTATPGENLVLAPRSGLATVMTPYPTSTLDPAPTQYPQIATTQQLKNPFRDPATVAAFNQALEMATGNYAGISTAAQVASYEAVAQYLSSKTFTSSSPYYTIQGARMPWHVQMHNQQQSYQTNMLDRALVQKRTANMQTLLWAYDNAVASDNAAYEAWDAAVIRACGAVYTPAPGQHPCTPTNPCTPPPTPSPLCVQLRKETPEPKASEAAAPLLAEALVAEFNNVDRVTGAIDNGCLGVNHNKCDWSPTMVAKEYLTTLDSQVAADTSMCDGTLGTSPASDLEQLPGQSMATTDEVYFGQALVAEAADVAQARSELSWSKTANDTIHYDLFDGDSSWSVGGSIAGASYSQQAFWEVKGEKSNGALCRLSGRIVGSANASGSVLGQSFTMLDADVQVGVGEMAADASDYSGYDAESHLRIGGYSVYDFPEQTQTGTLNEVLANVQYTDTLVDIPGQISWVSLDLKVDVNAGVSVSLTGTAPGACVAGVTTSPYSLGVAVTPSIGASAIGTALVGALGTGVGIQGTVDVLTASLPISVNTGFGPNSSGEVNLSLNANASLDLDVLSGEIDVAECVFGDCATQELYRWNGIPAYSDVLWNKSYTFPLLVVQNAFE
jgi:hypothetical protein